MYQYRNVLVRMRQGDSDRDITRSKTMGRKKLAQVREIAVERGWLAPDLPLPDDGVLATLFAHRVALPANCLSTLEPWREQVTKWHAAGIQGTTIHATLVRNHGYSGSYSSMHRFLSQLVPLQQPEVPLQGWTGLPCRVAKKPHWNDCCQLLPSDYAIMCSQITGACISDAEI
jgi:hypothetical protein